MPTINQLSSIDSIASGDTIPVYDADNGDARKASFTQVYDYIAAQLTGKKDELTAQYEAPTTGSTVSITDSSAGIWLILTPAGTLANLEIKFPSLANCVQGQEVVINCTQILTALTWDGNGSSVVGEPSTFAAADAYIKFKFDSVLSTWYRIG